MPPDPVTTTTEPTTPQAATIDPKALADAITPLLNNVVQPLADAVATLQAGGQRNFDVEAIMAERDKAKATNRDLAKQLESAKDGTTAAVARVQKGHTLNRELSDKLVNPTAALKMLGLTDAEVDALEVGEDGRLKGLDDIVKRVTDMAPEFAKAVEEAPPESTSPYQTISQVPAATGGGSKPINDDAIRENFVKDPHSVINSLLSGK